MPEAHKVSVAWQIVFTFVPILNLWAFYRIGKLRKYLLFVLLPSWVVTIILIIITPDDPSNIFSAMSIDPRLFIVSYLFDALFIGLGVYLVVKWSREHNRMFDSTTAQAS